MTMKDAKGLHASSKDKLSGKCFENAVASPQVHRRMQTGEENAALLKAGSFKSEYPYFWVVMQKTYLNNKTNMVSFS